MTYVCLWTPSWRTGAAIGVDAEASTPIASVGGARASGARVDSVPAASAAAPSPRAPCSPADLAPALLAVAPRVTAERRGVVWADARGLPARVLAERLLAIAAERGVGDARAGVAGTPVAAEVAARWCDPTVSPVAEVPPGGDRDFLALYPISVLEPSAPLGTLLDAVGLETCRDLAALDRESVEVRLGPDGVRLWQLARGDDRRPLFGPRPRTLPSASLDWVDYALTDPERLLFVVNALTESVCAALDAQGLGAREVTLLFSLANKETVTHALRLTRPSASRKAWMRRLRLALDRVTLGDAVTGLTLRVDSAADRGGQQGDLFDRGFASTGAAEQALEQLTEDQGAVVVVPENSEHPLLEQRTVWVENCRESGVGSRESGLRSRAPRAEGRGPLLARLALYLLPEPRPIAVSASSRRDHGVPVRYQDGGEWHGIVSAAGPDRVSGGQWDAPYAREYFRCVTDHGALVWLFRDARGDGWYLHGWWD